jgi:hypothetical protein
VKTYSYTKHLDAQTAIRLPRKDYEQLRARAEAEDRPVAQLIRRGVRLVLASAASGGMGDLADSDP